MFTKIHSDMFEDKRIIKLSALEKSALFYLMGNKNVNASGFYYVDYHHMGSFMRLGEDDVVRSLEKLEAADLIFFDEKYRIVFVRDFLSLNKVVSETQIKGMISGIDRKCIYSKHFSSYIRHLCINHNDVALAHRICKTHKCFDRVDHNTLSILEKYEKINFEPSSPSAAW